MKLHPIVFVLLAYGLAAVIALCVTFMVKVIAFLARRKEAPADKGAKAAG